MLVGTSRAIVVGLKGSTVGGPGSGGAAPPTPPVSCYRIDPFTRTVTGGWGTNPIDSNPWTIIPISGHPGITANYSVDGAQGIYNGPAATWPGSMAWTAAASYSAPWEITLDIRFTGTDWDLEMDFLDSAWATATSGFYVTFHKGASGELLLDGINVFSSGGGSFGPATSTLLIPSYDVTKFASLRFRLEAQILSIRAWYQGDPEPTTWNAIITSGDSTSYGGAWTFLPFTYYEFDVFHLGTGSALDQVIYLDNFALSTCALTPVFDDFHRVVADGWGTASGSGTNWIYSDTGPVSVDGYNGVVTIDNTGAGFQELQNPPTGAYGTMTAYTFTWRVQFDAAFAGSGTLFLQFQDANNVATASVFLVSSNTAFSLGGSFASTPISTPVTTGVNYYFIVQVDYNAGTLKSKFYRAQDADPGWQFTDSATGGFPGIIVFLGMWAPGTSLEAVDFLTDYIDVVPL